MKKIWIILSVFVVFAVIFFASFFEFQKSRKDFSAEEVLEQYLNTVFSIKELSDRNKLLAFTTGTQTSYKPTNFG